MHCWNLGDCCRSALLTVKMCPLPTSGTKLVGNWFRSGQSVVTDEVCCIIGINYGRAKGLKFLLMGRNWCDSHAAIFPLEFVTLVANMKCGLQKCCSTCYQQKRKSMVFFGIQVAVELVGPRSGNRLVWGKCAHAVFCEAPVLMHGMYGQN